MVVSSPSDDDDVPPHLESYLDRNLDSDVPDLPENLLDDIMEDLKDRPSLDLPEVKVPLSSSPKNVAEEIDDFLLYVLEGFKKIVDNDPSPDKSLSAAITTQVIPAIEIFDTVFQSVFVDEPLTDNDSG